MNKLYSVLEGDNYSEETRPGMGRRELQISSQERPHGEGGVCTGLTEMKEGGLEDGCPQLRSSTCKGPAVARVSQM